MWAKWLKVVPWYDVALFVLALMLGGGLWTQGYHTGHGAAERDGQVQLAQLQSRFESYRREAAEQQNAALLAWQQRYQAQVAAGHRADADFQMKKAELERENDGLKQQIADVTRQWVDEKGRYHPVKCVFTRGFVQQYNAALGFPASPGAGHHGSAAAASGGAGGAAGDADTAVTRLRDSGVSQADVLASVTDNARRCRVWRAQVNGLLDYLEGLHQ
ncbi:hypothetical protein PK12_004916 [Salmonella enterica subsp. enterica]|nr:hypothetical protein [Salmonella enterica subsp. enterica serovar Bonariensis]